MAGERRVRILSRLFGSEAPELLMKQLCEVCAEVTGVSGAGIMLMSADGPRGSVCTTDKASCIIEQLQYALGEGPGKGGGRIEALAGERQAGGAMPADAAGKAHRVPGTGDEAERQLGQREGGEDVGHDRSRERRELDARAGACPVQVAVVQLVDAGLPG